MTAEEEQPRTPEEVKRLLDAAKALEVNLFWKEIIIHEIHRLQSEADAGRNNIASTPADRETWLRALHQAREVLQLVPVETKRLQAEWDSLHGRR